MHARGSHLPEWKPHVRGGMLGTILAAHQESVSQTAAKLMALDFPLSAEHVGSISGYHCWAEFFVEPYRWIPVDASEAWKHPEKRDYFFGAYDENRVQFTVGRDIRHEPRQQGDPLNYFIYPYAEVDRKPYAVESKFSFRDRANTD